MKRRNKLIRLFRERHIFAGIIGTNFIWIAMIIACTFNTFSCLSIIVSALGGSAFTVRINPTVGLIHTNFFVIQTSAPLACWAIAFANTIDVALPLIMFFVNLLSLGYADFAIRFKSGAIFVALTVSADAFAAYTISIDAAD
jgi:hypothetical protein